MPTTSTSTTSTSTSTTSTSISTSTTSSSTSTSTTSSSTSTSSTTTTVCPRQMSGNWQRKNWDDGTNYWRARYDRDNDRFVFEWIAHDDIAADNWAENENARIDCSGFDAGAIDADLTVRGAENNIPITVHYSDGVDTYVAESDEASATGWAWENSTKVFDGVADGGTYRRVNLACNRDTQPVLWATAVFDDASNIWVKAKEESTTGDITGWDAAEDVSVNTNEATIYGQSVRSVGIAGAGKRDMIFAWKQDDDLYSRFNDNGAWENIQTIDTTAYAGLVLFDLEHVAINGDNCIHIIYIDADGSVLAKNRDSGDGDAWAAADTLQAASGLCSVGMVQHGDGYLYHVWRDALHKLEWRLHDCVAEMWSPDLGNDPNTFDPATDAVVDTETTYQTQTADHTPGEWSILANWIGKIGEDACEIGWGPLAGGTSTSTTTTNSTSTSTTSTSTSTSTTSTSTSTTSTSTSTSTTSTSTSTSTTSSSTSTSTSTTSSSTSTSTTSTSTSTTSTSTSTSTTSTSTSTSTTSSSTSTSTTSTSTSTTSTSTSTSTTSTSTSTSTTSTSTSTSTTSTSTSTTSTSTSTSTTSSSTSTSTSTTSTSTSTTSSSTSTTTTLPLIFVIGKEGSGIKRRGQITHPKYVIG